MLGKSFGRWHFKIFSYFSQKIDFDIPCRLSPLHGLSESIIFRKIRKKKSHEFVNCWICTVVKVKVSSKIAQDNFFLNFHYLLKKDITTFHVDFRQAIHIKYQALFSQTKIIIKKKKKRLKLSSAAFMMLNFVCSAVIFVVRAPDHVGFPRVHGDSSLLHTSKSVKPWNR